MVHSLLSVEPTAVRVHILATDVSKAQAASLSEMAASMNGHASVVRPALEQAQELPDFVPVVLWYRSFVAETLPDLDRALCVDTDLLFKAPVRELWETISTAPW